MNTRRTVAIRVGEEIANAVTIPQENRNAAEVQATANDQVPVNPSAMIDGEVRAALFQMSQAITTQAQALTAQANMEVAPRDQYVSIVASRLRDFTRMAPPKYFGSKVDEDLQDFLDEVYKICFLWG